MGKAKGKKPSSVEAVLRARSKRTHNRDSGKQVVQLCARVPREDWRKMVKLRDEEGLSQQEQIVLGLALLFERFGMEPPKALGGLES